MIKVDVKPGVIEVQSPYNAEFVSFARMRGGKWSDSKKVWIFDPRDEFAIRSTLIDIFGTDDYANCEKISVRVNVDDFEVEDEFVLFGRQLLRRRYSDRRVDVEDGVIVVHGGFPDMGGSRRYPEIKPHKGTVLEVRDVPRDIAVRVWAENKGTVELLGAVDIERLREEKATLLKRIEKIEQMIIEFETEGESDDLADLYD